MIHISKNKLVEIYRELEKGYRCFYHIESEEIKSMPGFNLQYLIEKGLWKDISNEIEADIHNFIEIVNFSPQEYFQIMTEFIDEVSDRSFAKQLLLILSSPKPYRNFKQYIQSSDKLNNEWLNFKEKKYCEWIEKQLEILNQNDMFLLNEKD